MSQDDISYSITIDVRWIEPANFMDVGREAIELATIIQRMRRHARHQITQPVLDGFADNFRTQSSAGAEWQRLADRTILERLELMHDPAMQGRLVPGFNEWRPILQRTGDYRSSWVDRDHPDHVEYWHQGATGQAPTQGSNLITIELGSDHPYMEKLEGGGESDDGSHVPAREVRIIGDNFQDMIGQRITMILNDEADRVPRARHGP